MFHECGLSDLYPATHCVVVLVGISSGIVLENVRLTGWVSTSPLRRTR